MELDTHKDLDHESKTKPHPGFKKTRVHFVYDFNHDGRHKTMLEADIYLTEIPFSSAYSGLVSLKGIVLVLFLAEINGLES